MGSVRCTEPNQGGTRTEWKDDKEGGPTRTDEGDDSRPEPMKVMTTEPNRILRLLMRDNSSEDPLQFD